MLGINKVHKNDKRIRCGIETCSLEVQLRIVLKKQRTLLMKKIRRWKGKPMLSKAPLSPYSYRRVEPDPACCLSSQISEQIEVQSRKKATPPSPFFRAKIPHLSILHHECCLAGCYRLRLKKRKGSELSPIM